MSKRYYLLASLLTLMFFVHCARRDSPKHGLVTNLVPKTVNLVCTDDFITLFVKTTADYQALPTQPSIAATLTQDCTAFLALKADKCQLDCSKLKDSPAKSAYCNAQDGKLIDAIQLVKECNVNSATATPSPSTKP